MAKKNKNSGGDVVGNVKLRIIAPQEITGEVLGVSNGSLVMRVKRKRSKKYEKQIVAASRIAAMQTEKDSPSTLADLIGCEVTILTRPEAEVMASPKRMGVGTISVNGDGFTVCNSPDGTFMVASDMAEVSSDDEATVGEKRASKKGKKKDKGDKNDKKSKKK